MHEQVIAHPHVVDIARQAMVDCDIEPQMKPIRGGTDGAQLSFMARIGFICGSISQSTIAWRAISTTCGWAITCSCML